MNKQFLALFLGIASLATTSLAAMDIPADFMMDCKDDFASTAHRGASAAVSQTRRTSFAKGLTAPKQKLKPGITLIADLKKKAWNMECAAEIYPEFMHLMNEGFSELVKDIDKPQINLWHQSALQKLVTTDGLLSYYPAAMSTLLSNGANPFAVVGRGNRSAFTLAKLEFLYDLFFSHRDELPYWDLLTMCKYHSFEHVAKFPGSGKCSWDTFVTAMPPAIDLFSNTPFTLEQWQALAPLVTASNKKYYVILRIFSGIPDPEADEVDELTAAFAAV